MSRSIVPFTVALFISMPLTSGLAQVGPAYLGSTVPFLNSEFCTRLAHCASAGIVELDGLQGKVRRLFYTVKLRKAQPYGRPSYTIYFNRPTNPQKSGGAALIYPAAQDSVEDGTFFKAFVTAMTGYDVSRAPRSVFMCDLRIRGQKTNFDVSINNISTGYASEQEFPGGLQSCAEQRPCWVALVKVRSARSSGKCGNDSHVQSALRVPYRLPAANALGDLDC